VNIGIVGLGVVGSACKGGFEELGHVVKLHDLKLGTSIEDVKDTELVFLCVPTPAKPNGECDTSIVESVVEELHKMKYTGVVCIKSTVAPGTTDRLSDKYPSILFAMVPEFLRERYALADFTEHHDLLVIGTYSDEVFGWVREAHGNFPEKVVQMTPTEAELVKYFNNTYNATLITFANSFYEVCKHYNVDYTHIKNVMVNRNHIVDMYLECNDNFRGFAGVCLPKDTKEIASVAKKVGVEFFDDLLKENAKYKRTVQDGMRMD
jgi:UDPglucose 6-dehydrogenase